MSKFALINLKTRLYMANNSEILERLVGILSPEEFTSFCTDYASRHPEMVDEMSRAFKHKLKGTERIDINQAVNECFSYHLTLDYYNCEHDDVDWNASAPRLHRLVNQAMVWAHGNNPQQAIKLGITMLTAIIDRIGEEMQWNEDYEYASDYCIGGAVKMLEAAIDNPATSKEEKLRVADELEEITTMDAFDYYFEDDESGSIWELMDRIRTTLLTVDEQLQVLYTQYDEETEAYKRDYCLGEIWDFLMDHDRAGEAEELYKQHSDSEKLAEKYGPYLEQHNRDDEALAVYDNMIAQGNYRSSLEPKLRVCMRKGYTQQAIETLRLQFANYGNWNGDKRMNAYKQLKKLVDSNLWPEEFKRLIEVNYRKNDLDNTLGDMLVMEKEREKIHDRILANMRHYAPPIKLINRYKSHFTHEQLVSITMSFKKHLPDSFHESNRKRYAEAATLLMHVALLCPEGKAMATECVRNLLLTHRNRPALREELANAGFDVKG